MENNSIAIISLLIALLLPALRAAREAAIAASCLSNQRQVGVACYVYATDFSGFLPGAYSMADEPGYTGTENRRAWYQYLVGPQYSILTSQPSGDRNLGPKLAQPSDVIKCPKTTGGSFGESYGMYYSHHPDPSTGKFDGKFMFWDGNLPGWDVYYGLRVDACPRPSDFLLIGCTTSGDSGRSYWYFEWNGPGSKPGAPYISLWMTHQSRVNGMYLDGHAEACGPEQLLGAPNFPSNATESGIRVWQMEDGTVVTN